MFETMKRDKKRTFYKFYVKFESYFESFNRETQKSSFLALIRKNCLKLWFSLF